MGSLDRVLNHNFFLKNIFDVAPWTIVPPDNGNGSLTKAVNVSIDSGIMDKAKWVGIVAMPSDDVSLRVKSEISQNCRQTTIVKQCSQTMLRLKGITNLSVNKSCGQHYITRFPMILNPKRLKTIRGDTMC